MVYVTHTDTDTLVLNDTLIILNDTVDANPSVIRNGTRVSLIPIGEAYVDSTSSAFTVIDVPSLEVVNTSGI